MNRTLIVYFSRKGENYWDGSLKDLSKGNTERVAEMIAELTGGQLFEVERAEPYSPSYQGCVKEAAAEAKAGARPQLKGDLENLKDYDTIFLGYPNWCGTMPMVLFTFLEGHDLTGKRIFPFCTNEGSGLGRSQEDLKKLCPGANVGAGLSVKGCQAAESRPAVEEWVKRVLGE